MTVHLIGLMSWLQLAVGLSVMVGALALAISAVDGRSRLLNGLLVAGLLTWGGWFALLGLAGRPDSLPANAFALAVAYVVVVRGRQVRGILDGELWWHPNRRG